MGPDDTSRHNGRRWLGGKLCVPSETASGHGRPSSGGKPTSEKSFQTNRYFATVKTAWRAVDTEPRWFGDRPICTEKAGVPIHRGTTRVVAFKKEFVPFLIKRHSFRFSKMKLVIFLISAKKESIDSSIFRFANVWRTRLQEIKIKTDPGQVIAILSPRGENRSHHGDIFSIVFIDME